MNFRLQPDETILKQGKANKSTLINAQGGELALTNQRLVFIGHGKNIGQDAATINLDDVMSFSKASSIFILFPLPIPNAIRIVTNSGQTIKFTVNGRKEWLTELQKAINK